MGCSLNFCMTENETFLKHLKNWTFWTFQEHSVITFFLTMIILVKHIFSGTFLVAGLEKLNVWYVPVRAIATLTILIHSTLNDFSSLHRLEFKPSSLHKPPFVFMTIWNVNNMVASALELFTLLYSLNASTDQSLSHSKWHIRGSFWLTFNEVQARAEGGGGGGGGGCLSTCPFSPWCPKCPFVKAIIFYYFFIFFCN